MIFCDSEQRRLRLLTCYVKKAQRKGAAARSRRLLFATTATYTYAYGDSNWKDKLTSYNGNAITYDAIGNPISYYNGYTFEWQNGRQLAGVTGNNQTISYSYNADGIRTSKTVNGVTTYYTLEGSNVVMETNGTDTLWFYYDASGSLTGFELNGTAYFYVKNLQGDIIAIVNSSGTKVVEYAYDSWGKLISTTGSLASTVGVKNPYRYRGYRYDTETGLYYLQSRYYDPVAKRFVNADGYVSTGQGVLGNNMFAYCNNNPTSMIDLTGKYPLYLVTYVATEVDGEKYVTTISFMIFDSDNPFSYFYAISVTETFEYTIDNYGFISMVNEDDKSGWLLIPNISYVLASEMRKHARSKCMYALEGRSLRGISFELAVHAALSIMDIFESATDQTDIGSVPMSSSSYDYNADWFEHPLFNFGEIFAYVKEKVKEKKMRTYSAKIKRVVNLSLKVIIIVLCCLPVLAFVSIFFSYLFEDGLLKHELDNKYINTDYSGWKSADIDGWDQFMIPESWHITESEEILSITDDSGQMIAFGTIISQSDSRFENIESFVAELTGYESPIFVHSQHVAGFVRIRGCNYSYYNVLNDTENQTWRCLFFRDLSKETENDSELYFLFPEDSAIDFDDHVEITQAIVFSYCFPEE